MPFALQTTKRRRARIHENETARARDLWEIDVELLEPDIAEQNSPPAWATAPANIDHATEFLQSVSRDFTDLEKFSCVTCFISHVHTKKAGQGAVLMGPLCSPTHARRR